MLAPNIESHPMPFDLQSLNLDQPVINAILNLRAQVNRFHSVFVPEPTLPDNLKLLITICQTSTYPPVWASYRRFHSCLTPDQLSLLRILGVDCIGDSDNWSEQDCEELQKLMNSKKKGGIPSKES